MRAGREQDTEAAAPETDSLGRLMPREQIGELAKRMRWTVQQQRDRRGETTQLRMFKVRKQQEARGTEGTAETRTGFRGETLTKEARERWTKGTGSVVGTSGKGSAPRPRAVIRDRGSETEMAV